MTPSVVKAPPTTTDPREPSHARPHGRPRARVAHHHRGRGRAPRARRHPPVLATPRHRPEQLPTRPARSLPPRRPAHLDRRTSRPVPTPIAPRLAESG